MVKPSLRQLIWFFCFLIIFEVVWLDFRINKLAKLSPEYLQAQQKQKIDEQLKQIPEPEIKKTLVKGGRLWLEPKEASFSANFSLKVMAETDERVDKVFLRLYYPKNVLRVTDENWFSDDNNGIATWSGTLNQWGKFMVKTINFEPLKTGEARIDFDFDKESLLDSNLMTKEGKEILEEVSGGTYQIKSLYPSFQNNTVPEL